VQKSPAATLPVLAEALCGLLGKPDHPISIIGTRHGEKVYESLLSREERLVAEDQGNYYRVPADNRDLNYAKYISEGESRIAELTDYNSHNTQRLNVEGMKALLLKLDFIRDLVAGRPATLVD
jgi:UDP-glucose 4-epimerase